VFANYLFVLFRDGPKHGGAFTTTVIIGVISKTDYSTEVMKGDPIKDEVPIRKRRHLQFSSAIIGSE
jgi:hypothetical protein